MGGGRRAGSEVTAETRWKAERAGGWVSGSTKEPGKAMLRKVWRRASLTLDWKTASRTVLAKVAYCLEPP